ncbi:MAG: hypothetical protein COV44_09275 [Deltaproteobacteria bacterium CG11_big_fil_rev_8_21_14_0_20_45_16]|nr:MAG: hypothetical protein COV44_09275 [Deltaproteobacteria bacterium CG11_big_fil_rev_8_21_14_0_20_45_16]
MTALSSSHLVADDNLQDLYIKQQQVVEILNRFQKGAESCNNTSCQKEKRIALHAIHNRLDSLPNFMPFAAANRWESLASAHALIDRPAKLRKSNGPKSIADWIQWWNARYELDLERGVRWSAFMQDISSYREGLRYLLRLSRLPMDRQERIRETWNLEIGRAAYRAFEGKYFSEQADLAFMESNKLQADEFDRRSHEAANEVSAIESTLKVGIRAKLREIFPELSEESIMLQTAFFWRLGEDFGHQDLFHPEFQEYLAYINTDVVEIFNRATTFDDLEYGVLGLDNFDSRENPLVQYQTELKIQRELDSVDGWARFVLNSANSMMLFAAAQNLGGANRLLSMGMGGASTYFFMQSDIDLANLVWKPSMRSKNLQSLMDSLESKLQIRHASLKMGVRKATEKLQLIESQIFSLEQQQQGGLRQWEDEDGG